jgi:hypothetical protein
MALSKIRSDSLEDTAIHGNRNLIINGAMQVAQRGTSATVGPNGTGEGYTVVDRFQNSLTGSVVSTFSQSTDAPSGFANSAKIEITTADTSLGGTEFWHLRYGFEGQDLQSIAKGTSDAKALTVSFWVKSNKTGTYTVELQDIDNSRRNSLAYTIDSSNTWEHKSLTYNPDTAGSGFANSNAQSLRMNFWFVAGADFKSGTFYNGTWGVEDNAKRVHSSQVNLGDTVGNEWYITGVQMELGEQDTPFEHRSFGDELRRCQRYYWQLSIGVHGNYPSWAATGYNTNQCNVNLPFPVPMRTIPTASFNVGNVNYYRFYRGGSFENFTNVATDTITREHLNMYGDGLSHTQGLNGSLQIRLADNAGVFVTAEL